MRWPPNPWPSGNCLTSWLPELLWVSGCFQLRPCRAHIPATSLRCVSWGDGPATPTLQIFLLCTRNRNQNGGSKQRQPMPGHRLCDKDPSHLKAVLHFFLVYWFMQLLIVISSTPPFVLWKSGHYFLKLSYGHLGVHANSTDHLEL